MKLNTLLSQKWFAHTLAVCIACVGVLIVNASQAENNEQNSDNLTFLEYMKILPDEAWIAIANNNIELMLALLPPHAEAGNEYAIFGLGAAHIQGYRDYQNIEKGQEWLLKIIPSEHGIPETLMAQSCDQPIVETIDYECALKWYEAAYEKQAVPPLVFRYALLLIDEEAKQFEPDYQRKSFEALDSIKNISSYKNDGYFNWIYSMAHIWGIGTQQNLNLGAKHLTIAADEGSPVANGFLYHLHFHGLIDGASPEQAAYYKKKALAFMSKDALENFLDEDDIALLKQENGNGEWR